MLKTLVHRIIKFKAKNVFRIHDNTTIYVYILNLYIKIEY